MNWILLIIGGLFEVGFARQFLVLIDLAFREFDLLLSFNIFMITEAKQGTIWVLW